jgi:hypothetical protein
MPPDLPAFCPGSWRALGGLAAEAALGCPDALHRRIPHPVVWIGSAISALERRWNRPLLPAGARRALGALTLLLALGGAAAVGWALRRRRPRARSSAAQLKPGLLMIERATAPFVSPRQASRGRPE